ncbi:MAG: DUF362 domain-containing protein [candidate division KSB1 bacterium]|nr:DUF362 domain-containing protein [candidate division KSB1 bacterium]MDZ7386782.1 DUF362 domain-containing protein [candidate division KSB1 bacterium]MDZ7393986.1 DUF362 domain-containing protein [candidate division KSB1 bacterium]
MKREPTEDMTTHYPSRRQFLSAFASAGAGLFLSPFLKSTLKTWAHPVVAPLSATVAVTQAESYERTLVRRKVEHLFDALGGISDMFGAGSRVVIKVNLTGGSGSAGSARLQGVPITESMWTHPEVLRAVAELVIDCGVRPGDIYFVEALWDSASYFNFGYSAVQQQLGARMVDLNQPAPYSHFVDLPVGDRKFFYDSFRVNQILRDVDVYISIPKLKQHYEAGVTAALKNQVGIVPKQLYETTSNRTRREAIHTQGGPSSAHLPRAICDLNLARPVHLAVIDGVKNARGGEGVWNPTFRVAEDHVLVAGREPVAADAVATYLMGIDQEAETLPLPGGGQCDNHLHLLSQRGVGTNQLSAIHVVGDGAGLVTAVQPGEMRPSPPTAFTLYPNYPNPFNTGTMIGVSLPQESRITLEILDGKGILVAVPFSGRLGAGYHQFHWQPRHLPSGIYFCRVRGEGVAQSVKLVYQK